MISFESDYTTGAHPRILEKLVETNYEHLSGYGSDPYSKSAGDKILNSCNCPDGDVFFLVGGTQTNSLIISAMLRDYEGVVAADTGHVSLHEAGAVEYTGHKVLNLPQHDGKICADELDKYLSDFYGDENHEHMVFPGMVYVSYPTESGTIYSMTELEAISNICRKYEIPLFLDGARLGYGLMCDEADMTLADIAKFCDVFYIGGTKVGALCGEAVIFTHNNAPKHFTTIIKQHGALLAKGRLLGIQFDTLFTDDLYWNISKHAIDMAKQLRAVLMEKDCVFAWETPTNQQFVILENTRMEELKKSVAFSFWEKYDDTHTIVRFATSWSTTEEDIEYLRKVL